MEICNDNRGCKGKLQDVLHSRCFETPDMFFLVPHVRFGYALVPVTYLHADSCKARYSARDHFSVKNAKRQTDQDQIQIFLRIKWLRISEGVICLAQNLQFQK